MLDCVDLEVAPQPDGRLPHSDTIIERYKAAWENFKSFNHDAIVTATTHCLFVDLLAIGAGFAKGLSEVEAQQLEDEVEDAVKKLANDIGLFGETGVNGEAR